MSAKINELKGVRRFKGLNLIAIEDSPYGFYKEGDTFKIFKTFHSVWQVNSKQFFEKSRIKIILDDLFLKVFKKEKIAVNCVTNEEATAFSEFIGYDSYGGHEEYCIFYDKELQMLNGWNIEGLNRNDYTIIKFSDCIERKQMLKEVSSNKVNEYKVIKPFTLKDILEKYPCMSEFNKLVKELNEKEKDAGFEFYTRHLSVYSTLNNNLDWLEDKGFIERENTFEPFDITFNINSADELKALYCKLNCSIASVKQDNKNNEYYTQEIFKYVDNLFNNVDKEMYRVEE